MLTTGCINHQTTPLNKENASQMVFFPQPIYPVFLNNTQFLVTGDDFVYFSSSDNLRKKRIDRYSFTHAWIFGDGNVNDIETNGQAVSWSNAYYINGAVTSLLPNGTYYLVFQHPDQIKKNSYDFPVEIVYNITINSTKHQIIDKSGLVILNISDIENNQISGKEAADILCKALSNDDPDQFCERTTVNITRAWVSINPISDHQIGDNFTINGSTNVHPIYGDNIHVLILSVNESELLSVYSDSIPIKKGVGNINTWSYSVNTTSLMNGTYQIRTFSDPDFRAFAKQNFSLRDGS